MAQKTQKMSADSIEALVVELQARVGLLEGLLADAIQRLEQYEKHSSTQVNRELLGLLRAALSDKTPARRGWPLVLDDCVDAERLAKEYPATFERPGTDLLLLLRPGDSVKITRNGERFWVKLTDVRGLRLEGTVDNQLVFNPDLPLGREICFERRHVYDVRRCAKNCGREEE